MLRTMEKYLNGLQGHDFRMDLGPVRQVCERLGNPQFLYPVLHVAGTNGKGSTCAFLESLLRSAGLKVGLITSPHLTDLRERVQVNRQLISEKDLGASIEMIRKVLPSDDFLSFFEIASLPSFFKP